MTAYTGIERKIIQIIQDNSKISVTGISKSLKENHQILCSERKIAEYLRDSLNIRFNDRYLLRSKSGQPNIYLYFFSPPLSECEGGKL